MPAVIIQLLLILLFMLNVTAHAEVLKVMTNNKDIKKILLHFANPQHFRDMGTVSDTVMGGRSSGGVKLTDDKSAVQFFGDLSLENNGGFSSVEFSLVNQLPEWPFKQLCLKADLDGRRYQLRLKTANTPSGVAYAAWFSAANNGCFTFVLTDFNPRYRGREVAGLPALQFAEINQISIMLADKIAAPFKIVLHTFEIK